MRYRFSVPSLIGLWAVMVVSFAVIAGTNGYAAKGDALEQMIEEFADKSDGRDTGSVSRQPDNSQSGDTSAGETQETVLSIQKWLKALGCYNGAIDGVWGPGSRRGLKAAIGESDGSATRANLNKIQAVAHLDVCKDLPKAAPVVKRASPNVTVEIKPAPPKVVRRKRQNCMTFPACMKGCREGTLGRGVGAICTYVCGPEIPICPN